MRRTATGLWLAATMLLACHVGANWVRAGYGGKVQPPAKNVETLPTVLAGWRAVEDIPLDRETANVLGAGDSVSRVYRNAFGETASIHVAVWTDFKVGPTGLHYPEVCYPNAGWQIRETQTDHQPNSDGIPPLRYMLMEQSGRSIVTAHWYEMGQSTFFSRDEAREIQRGYWGERDLPFVTKALIQVSTTDLDGAKPRIEELAQAIAQWTQELRSGG